MAWKPGKKPPPAAPRLHTVEIQPDRIIFTHYVVDGCTYADYWPTLLDSVAKYAIDTIGNPIIENHGAEDGPQFQFGLGLRGLGIH